MANYRNISIRFWEDPKVDDEFTPEDKYFYLYLLTNPHSTISGCYEVSKKQVTRETGYNWDTCEKLLFRLDKVLGVIRYCEETKEVLILNWSRYNWSRSLKLRKAVEGVTKHTKSAEFRRIITEKLDEMIPETDGSTVNSNTVNSNTVNSISVSSNQRTDTVTQSTVGSIGNRYSTDTVSKKQRKGTKFSNFSSERDGRYYDEIEKKLMEGDM